ncbi:MAG: LlaJI family restriction endonuclease [Cetobacterium sp.]|uniref:LlaJI family restriction endonuclease n=1 Tax=Cetobacterium sp. TaxID=2071632 RepID=UPI003EE768B6
MEIEYFRELELFDLTRIFNLENNQEINFLIENKILILKNLNIGYFKFVGIITLSNKTIIVYPKYKYNFSLDKNKNDYLKLLFKSFEKYSKNSNYFLEKEFNDSNEYFNLFSLYKNLINDYIENGLYENEKNIHTLCGDGEIDWDKTIDELDNHFNRRGNPIYLDYYTHDIEEEQENYIRSIQKNLLTKAGEYFEQFKEIGLEENSFDFHFDGEILGDEEHQIYKIDLELRNVFSERKIYLLQLMRIILKRDIQGNDFIKNIYGTKFFHSVWESICQDVFGHQKDLKEIIEKPLWVPESGKSLYKNFGGTFVPDIVFKNDKKDELHIYDAKYYETDFDENGRVSDVKPGIGDISKQFLYEECFRIHYNQPEKEKKLEQIKTYRNAFLFPVDSLEGTDRKKIGKVTFNIFKEKKIELFKLETSMMYKNYINNRKIKLEF